MRCGIYVRVSTDDQNEFYETVSKKYLIVEEYPLLEKIKCM